MARASVAQARLADAVRDALDARSLSGDDADTDTESDASTEMSTESDESVALVSEYGSGDNESPDSEDEPWRPKSTRGREEAVAAPLPWWASGYRASEVESFLARRAAEDRRLTATPSAGSVQEGKEGIEDGAEEAEDDEEALRALCTRWLGSCPVAAGGDGASAPPLPTRADSTGFNEDCAICLEGGGVLEEGMHFEMFPAWCGHFFCSACLSKCQLRKGCPLCRAKPDDEEGDSDVSEEFS